MCKLIVSALKGFDICDSNLWGSDIRTSVHKPTVDSIQKNSIFCKHSRINIVSGLTKLMHLLQFFIIDLIMC